MPSRIIFHAPDGQIIDKAILGRFDFQVSDLIVAKNGRSIDVLSPQPKDVIRSTLNEADPPIPYDVFILREDAPLPKLLICDMDSTILEQETLDELAAIAGVKAKVSAITERAMQGELNFTEALIERVAMLKGLEEQKLFDLMPQLSFSKGAEELIHAALRAGIVTVLVSGGFTHFSKYVADKLGFQHHFSNELMIKKGRLTGEVKKPIQDKNTKQLILQDFVENLDISSAEVIAIGDGANDVPMIKAAGYGIAYKAKPIVTEAARFHIEYSDLSAVASLFSSRSA